MLVDTSPALSTFNAHAHTGTYARVHIVAHHADPESKGGRNLVTFNLYVLISLPPNHPACCECAYVFKGWAVRCEKQEMSIQIRISPNSYLFS